MQTIERIDPEICVYRYQAGRIVIPNKDMEYCKFRCNKQYEIQ